MNKLNETIYNLTPKETGENPFNRLDAELWNYKKLNNDEFLIMSSILSEKTERKSLNEKVFILNRKTVANKLNKRGMGWRKFGKSWNTLKKKGYIVKVKRLQGNVLWTVNENPNLESTNISITKTSFKETKTVEPKVKQRNYWEYDPENPLTKEEIENLPRGGMLYISSREQYLNKHKS